MKWLFQSFIFAGFFALLLMTKTTSSMAAPLFSINDSMTIYYQLDNNDRNCSGITTLGEYVKFTLPFEWPAEANVMQRAEGIEAFKAGAVAIRTNAISVYHTKEVIKGGTTYLCALYGRQNHRPNDPNIGNFPNAQQAVIDTNGIILTHPDATAWENTQGRTVRTGAIDAQYRDDTGQWTNTGDYPWLEGIYDPISTGSSGTGMGQEGTRRWAWGESDSGQEYPKWNYRQILAHYYQYVDFVGVSPDPPDNYRSNMLQIINGIPPQGDFTMQKGEERTGISLLWQNTGHWVWPTNGVVSGELCPGDTTYYTLVGYHLYRTNGTPACDNCIGIRRTPICRSSQTLGQGEHHWLNGFHVYIPDDPAITPGTYLLRFDVEHRYDSVWEGYTYGFTWPPQDIPVQIVDPPDDEPPSNPNHLDSGSSHVPNNWSDDNTVYAEWSGASDNRTSSGQLAYSIEWTTSPSTIPDTIPEPSGNSNTSPPLVDGNWWLHIRTRDQAGNWADGAAHFGPFLIDTAPPMGSHNAPDWYLSPDFTVSWSGMDASGVVFDFDYALNNGSYQDWFTTTASSGSRVYDRGANINDFVHIRACLTDLVGHPASPPCSYSHTAIHITPYLDPDPASLTTCFALADTTPQTGTVFIKNRGPGSLDWTAVAGPYLSLNPTSGTNVVSGFPGILVYTLTNPSVVGQHTTVITVSSPTADVGNNPVVVPVPIRVAPDQCVYYQYLPTIFKTTP